MPSAAETPTPPATSTCVGRTHIVGHEFSQPPFFRFPRSPRRSVRRRARYNLLLAVLVACRAPGKAANLQPTHVRISCSPKWGLPLLLENPAFSNETTASSDLGRRNWSRAASQEAVLSPVGILALSVGPVRSGERARRRPSPPTWPVAPCRLSSRGGVIRLPMQTIPVPAAAGGAVANLSHWRNHGEPTIIR